MPLYFLIMSSILNIFLDLLFAFWKNPFFKIDRVRQVYRKGLTIMAAFSLVMIPLFQFGGEFIMKLFVSEEDVIAFANGIVEMLGRICFAKPLTLIPVIRVWGVWLATALTWFAAGTFNMLRYFQGKWKKGKES